MEDNICILNLNKFLSVIILPTKNSGKNRIKKFMENMG